MTTLHQSFVACINPFIAGNVGEHQMFVTFKLLHRWVLRLGRGTCVSGNKSGGCRRLVSGYAGYVVFASRANPRFSAFIHDLFIMQSPLIVRTTPSVLRAVLCPHGPVCINCRNGHISSAPTNGVSLCNSRSYNSRTLAGCLRCHAQRMHSAL